MNVGDISTSVKRMFGDESGVQITDTDVIRWINQGQRQIVMQNESLLETTATSNSVANQQDYALPTDLLILRTVMYRPSSSNSYWKLKGHSLAEFNEMIDGWDGSEVTPGVPYIYTIFSSEYLVFPVPDESLSNAFKIYYNRTPVDVETSTDTPDLPILYHDVLVKHCVQQAYELDEDWDAAGNKVTEVDRDINLLRGREDWKTQETYSTITVRVEDMY